MSTAAVSPEHDAHAPSANCPNCEAVVSGHFCANCGQEAILHHASTREFLHEFIGHYVALEGKLWGTLTRLLFRPGALTNEYIRGRRVRFVQPLRLYLTLSLIFFALLKFTSGFEPAITEDTKPETLAAKATADAAKTVGKIAQVQAAASAKALTPEELRGKAAAEAAVANMDMDQALPEASAPATPASASASAPDGKPAEKTAGKSAEPQARAAAEKSAIQRYDKVHVDEDDVESWLANWPTLRHQWHAFDKLSREEQRKVFKEGVYHYAPYVIFCLMPVFALLLKILYLGSGRRFGEHLLFALHTNAFAYFMFSVMLLIDVGIVKALLWCWVLGYLPWAMRRVYHRGRFGTFVRWATLMFFYIICIGLGLLASMGMGIMTVGH